MASRLRLPAGLAQRPLSVSDADAVAELMAAQERHDVGVVDTDVADILGDWGRPSVDLATSTLGVFDGPTLVAYGELVGPDHADTAVHPGCRGLGIGTALAGWLRETAQETGWTMLAMQVPQGGPGDRLLTALGFELRWTAWDLELPVGRELPNPVSLPAGYALRDATSADHEGVWRVLEDAFLEWSDRERSPIEDFASRVWLRPGFEPWNLRVATGPGGAVVGVAFVVRTADAGVVDRLAVHWDHRGLGLARALLGDAFTQAGAHGATRSVLSTDSRTGALGLYERVGMRVTSTWVNRATAL